MLSAHNIVAGYVDEIDILQNVSVDVQEQQITSVIGPNGSGKSTLMNIIYGLYKPTEGEIYVNGQKAEMRNPKDAIALGIGMVHQHRKLIPAHSVLENILLGHPPQQGRDESEAGGGRDHGPGQALRL